MAYLHMTWAMPGVLCAMTLCLGACGSDGAAAGDGKCIPLPGSGGAGAGDTGGDDGTGGDGASNVGGSGNTVNEPPLPGGKTTGKDGNTFDHFNDPGSSGSKDPFEILKERAEEGPPEVRTRLHSCTKIQYAALGSFLSSRGVDLGATSAPGQLPTAGELYAGGGDAMGTAKYDAREGEVFFHTASGATKLFDIFVQAAPEIIANIETAAACQVGGVGQPMFAIEDGSCVADSLTCIMGRPATDEDLILCNLMVSHADGSAGDIANKRNITVAAFLAAAHTCE
jgi:hypothetical protein